ncbi:YifB family Mg chelatase-like AAA ATPase [uncultured Alistipes sp.]|uniref:YifB family Mg chelatase-like AAA ATPase n=1 Tax=uncultured Alistipes sp. TaxID=538949 RepID=UPI0025FCC391|nr:YifB family Mg chelatase-like AAA ATPase [uncultured Alistipes sp.]
MFVRTYAGAIVGIDAVAVTVEVNIAGGGLGMYLVGLPDSAVKESEQRIRAAFENSGERMSGRKVVVSLAPADLRKEGASFDLPIAVGILAAMSRINTEGLSDTMFAGELSLDGTLKPVRGMLPIAVRARNEGLRRLVVPVANAAEAAVVDGIEVIGAESLKDVIGLLNGELEIAPAVPAERIPFDQAVSLYEEDFADVKGQSHVKRALEIAAAGGHNVLMIGSPGSGKTMLARRMPTILPPLSQLEALETTKTHSVAGTIGPSDGLMARRPYRAPHHTISQVALIGGGQSPRPGEVSLAHNGVLFLDELPEFGRSVLEVLRQPLEDKKITVSRAKYSVEYPANFTLLAAMNPCPCGYYNHPSKECTCSPGSVHRYMSRISGPLMDRIDLHVEVTPVPAAELSAATPGEPSVEVRRRVIAARMVQAARFADLEGVHTNAMMNTAMLREYCRLDAASATLLERAMERLNLSARAYDRILKVARTIADLAGRDDIVAADVAEAINYRSLDRGNWGR